MLIGFIILLRVYHHKVHHISLLLQVGAEFLAWNPYLIGLATLSTLVSLLNFLLWKSIVLYLVFINIEISGVSEQPPFTRTSYHSRSSKLTPRVSYCQYT
jgi:hypothetical protein